MGSGGRGRKCFRGDCIFKGSVSECSRVESQGRYLRKSISMNKSPEGCKSELRSLRSSVGCVQVLRGREGGWGGR